MTYDSLARQMSRSHFRAHVGEVLLQQLVRPDDTRADCGASVRLVKGGVLSEMVTLAADSLDQDDGICSALAAEYDQRAAEPATWNRQHWREVGAFKCKLQLRRAVRETRGYNMELLQRRDLLRHDVVNHALAFLYAEEGDDQGPLGPAAPGILPHSSLSAGAKPHHWRTAAAVKR